MNTSGSAQGDRDFLDAEDGLRPAVVEFRDHCEEDMRLRVYLLTSEMISWKDLHLVKRIDGGSFGEVYLAKLRGQDVSVKRCILRQDGSMTKEQLHNLEREINTYHALDNPFIVKYIGCVLEHPHLAVVTEYLPNGNVFDLLYLQKVNLPAHIRLKMAHQVSGAILYMHSCDPTIIHRDLKTQNLVIDAEYGIKICDFGKTQALGEEVMLQLKQDNLGSPRYMAPECFRNGSIITEKVDIWSLGCCLVEIFGGPLPYEHFPQMAEVYHCLEQQKPPMVPHWFTQRVRPMLSKCFEFDPDERIRAGEVIVVLRELTPEELERHGMDKRRIA